MTSSFWPSCLPPKYQDLQHRGQFTGYWGMNLGLGACWVNTLSTELCLQLWPDSLCFAHLFEMGLDLGIRCSQPRMILNWFSYFDSTEEPRNVQTLARWVCWPYLGRVPLFSPKCQVQPESKGCLVSLVCNIERRGWTELWVLCTTEDSLPMMQCKRGCAEADRRAVNEFAVIKPIYIHMCIMSLCSALSL